MEIKVAIHQPNFMPWFGFFYKINKSDIFVFLDHVKMDVKNSKWLKRVKMINNDKVDWISIPLQKPEFGHMQRVVDIKIDLKNKNFIEKKNQILNQYYKCPFFNEIEPIVLNFFEGDIKFISERNIDFSTSIINLLKINVNLIKSSELEITSKKNQMNIDIVKKLEGSIYISGMGAEYQIENDFINQGLKLEYSNFNPSSIIYDQFALDDFFGNLSIIDMISNIGSEEIIKTFLNK